MEACIDYACCLLARVLESRLRPVAAAMDARADAVEDGAAAARAAEIQKLLARLYREKANTVEREEVVAAHDASRWLLRSFWEATVGDVRNWSAWLVPYAGFAGRAGRWAFDLMDRAAARAHTA